MGIPLVDWFWGPATFFVWHPARALIISSIFLLFFVVCIALKKRVAWTRSWPLLLAAIAWALFAYNEHLAHRKGWNIRVDLLFTWPILVLLSLNCIILSSYWVYGSWRRKGAARTT